jgi:HEAT repeat protein
LKNDKPTRDRRLAGIAQLGVIEATTEAKVSALIAALNDEEVVFQAIKTLETYGKDAKEAIPALKKLKTSMKEAVKNAAITALAKIE